MACGTLVPVSLFHFSISLSLSLCRLWCKYSGITLLQYYCSYASTKHKYTRVVSCRVVYSLIQPHPSRGKGAGAYRNPATTTVCNVLYVCTVQSKYRIGNGDMEMEKENGKWKMEMLLRAMWDRILNNIINHHNHQHNLYHTITISQYVSQISQFDNPPHSPPLSPE